MINLRGRFQAQAGGSFDGTASTMSRAALTGVADATGFTFSGWMRRTVSGALQRLLRFENASGAFWVIGFGTTNAVSGFTYEPGGVRGWDWASNATTFVAQPQWYHILWSMTNTGAGPATTHRLYVNDVSIPVTSTVNNLTLNEVLEFTPTNVNVASGLLPSAVFNAGDFAELWWDPIYRDFDDMWFRRRFIGGNGRPANLGGFGEAPFGTRPALYLQGPGARLGFNRGTGGDFTTVTLVGISTSSPSQGVWT